MTKEELISKVENHELDHLICKLIIAKYEGYGQGRMMIRKDKRDKFYFEFDHAIMRIGVDESDIVYQVVNQNHCNYFDPKSWKKVHDENGNAAITRSDFGTLTVGEFKDLRKINNLYIIDTFITWLDDLLECFLNDERKMVIQYIKDNYNE